MQLFFATQVSENEIILSADETRHCLKALRLSAGDRVTVTDGRGNMYYTTIADENPKGCRLTVQEKHAGSGKRDYRISIAIAPTKNAARFEWFLEKATEMGVDHIVPMVSEYSERRRINRERSEKIVVSAMKQSLGVYLPAIAEMKTFDRLVESPFAGLGCIAHVPENEPPHLKNVYQKGSDVMILIGPEGGFSAGELKKALGNGYMQINLGHNRLRTETAGLVACQVIHLLNEQ